MLIPPVSGWHQATTVQDIQEFSFKGYDQQPPGFSKPGFWFLGRLVWKLILPKKHLMMVLRTAGVWPALLRPLDFLENNPGRKTSNDGPSDSGPGSPTFWRVLPMFFKVFTDDRPPQGRKIALGGLVYKIN